MFVYDDDLMTDDDDDVVAPTNGMPKGFTEANPRNRIPFKIELITDYANFQPAYPSVFRDVDYKQIFGRPPAQTIPSEDAASSSGISRRNASLTDSTLFSSSHSVPHRTDDTNHEKSTSEKPTQKRSKGFQPLSNDIDNLLTDDEGDSVQIINEIKHNGNNEPEVIQLDDDEQDLNVNIVNIINNDNIGHSAQRKKPALVTNNARNPRFSQVERIDMSEVIRNKRALREKNLNRNDISSRNESRSGSGASNSHSESANGSPPTTSNFQLSGRAISPTVYTPEREEMCTSEEISRITGADVSEFLRVLLSLDLAALNFDYSEEMITKHLRKHHMVSENVTINAELPLTYESLNHYKSSYLPRIFYDGWAQIVDDYHQNHYERLKMSCQIETRLEPEIITIFLGACVPMKDVHLFFRQNWVIIVQECSIEKDATCSQLRTFDGDSNNKMALGFVTDATFKNCDGYTTVNYIVKIASNKKNLKLIANQKWVFIQPICYFRPVIRYVETLSLMNFKRGFYRSFLKPDLNTCLFDFRQPEGFRFFDAESFNSQQKNAIVGCFNAVQQPYSTNKTVMIQGPPGTGKTHTLVGIVKNMFINCSESKSKPLRILICAPSNGAIDEIAIRLIRDRDFLREFKEHKLRLVRIGQRSQVHPKVKTYLLDQLVEQNYQFCQRSRLKSELRDELLMNANVILSTLNSVQLTCMNMFRQENISSKKAIRCVIVDEASQSTEPELLMPLIYPISKLILIGDHLQLPATVISRVALRMGYGRSLFERLYRHFESMETSNPMLTLCRQFRMIHPICVFPSMHFYKGLLETPKGTGQNPRIPIQPYFLFDVVNAYEKTTSNLINASKFNVVEADFIFKLLLIILDKLGYPVSDDSLCELPERLHVTIGVITFYRGQKQELIKRLEAFHGGILQKHIDVNTVDAFQGQERDIVILSCVRAFDRTGDNNSVGFVRLQQRMNVALTRAKSVLFICIHAKSFINVPRWQQLLNDAMSRNRYVRMTSKVTNEALKRKISL